MTRLVINRFQTVKKPNPATRKSVRRHDILTHIVDRSTTFWPSKSPVQPVQLPEPMMPQFYTDMALIGLIEVMITQRATDGTSSIFYFIVIQPWRSSNHSNILRFKQEIMNGALETRLRPQERLDGKWLKTDPRVRYFMILKIIGWPFCLWNWNIPRFWG